MCFSFGFLGVCALSALLLTGCGNQAELCEGVVCEDDGNGCTDDVCNPATGTCRHVTVEDDTPCDFNGLPGLCQAGVCVDAMLCEGVVCEDDGDECTDGACNPSSGSCENTPVHDGTACADGRGGCYDGVCNFVPVSATVGDKELVFDWTSDRCEDSDVPDGPADFVRDENGQLVLFDGNAPTYYISRGAFFDSLTRVCDPPALVSAGLWTPESYENGEWLWAIYREGSEWHALIHNEFHDPVAPTCKPGDPSPANLCWYNSVTYALSTDGGSTFMKPLSPAHLVAPAPAPWIPPAMPVEGGYLTSGYFNPSTVVRGPEDYHYSIIGAVPQQGGPARGACAIRTKTLGDPASWRAWDGTGFNLALESPYEIGAVAEACTFLTTPEEAYPVAGNLMLTYNTYVERYMLVTQWADASDPSNIRCGVYFSLSTDLIHWSDVQEIAPARINSCPTDQTLPGQLEPVLILYPSVVDHQDSTINFERPGRTPYLYYTRFNDDTQSSLDRDLVRVPLKFTMGGPLCEGVDCDDQNACTDDICNGADGSCENISIECKDSNDCTIDTCNPSIGCEYAAAPNGTLCQGGLGTCQDGACAFPCTEQGIVDAIAIGGGPHTFACAIPTTVLTTAEIFIDNDVILDGQDKLAIDGNQSHRVFSVPTGTTAELIGLTVMGGAASLGGGGIANNGTLTLTDTTVSGNTANGNGGGIDNHGTLSLKRSTVSGNRGASGGGIYVGHAGILTVTNSTLSGNVTDLCGGGIDVDGDVTLINTTVSRNTSNGCADELFSQGSLVLTASIVSGDADAACDGEISSEGYNIESPGNTCGFDQTGDQPGVTEAALNLGPLTDNGGPTMTHKPGDGGFGEGSVAMDQIPEADCEVTEDQRGEPRPETGGTDCDVGSVEVQ